MPVNINDPEYTKAEIWFHEAKDLDEQLLALNKMISHAPGHKGAENLRQQLTTRRKKLELTLEKKKRSGKSSKIGIRKDEMQAVIIGKTNSGKSSLLKVLTNASPKISENKFTTTRPQIGMMGYATTSIQLVEIPATDSEFYDKGIVYTADTVLIVANSLEDLNEIINLLKTNGKKIIVMNKSDLLSQNEKRKLRANLKSKYKKYEFVIISTKTKENIEELKDKLFQSFNKLRIYTKEPGKEVDKKRPMILVPGQSVKDCAEKILKGFSQRVKQVRIWGPSSKFPGQIVGMKHKVKDLDIVEFKTK
jgi:ribosome-interacting GTPase 1